MSKSKLIVLISSIIAVIAIALTVTLIIVLKPKADPANNGSIGEARSIKVVQLEGSATLSDGTETIDCFKGMNLYDGDHIDVKENSVLVARFDEDKYVYFAENTSINIKSTGKDKYKTNIFVEKGKVLAELINKLGEDEEFFLSSNNSVMAVRGTVFGVEVLETALDFKISYSVYKGVTELYAFDKKDGNLISGKLTDLSNKKVELTVPKSDVLSEEENEKVLNNWLKDVDTKFADETAANDELAEVEIKVDVPSEEDYKQVIDTISKETGKTIAYSNIDYSARSFYGEYDGLNHQIELEVSTPNSKITYKTEENSEYSNDVPSFNIPGIHRVYYKIEVDGYTTKEDYALVSIDKADLKIEYKNNIILTGLIAGRNVSDALSKINLFDYINVIGAENDSEMILNSSFSCDDLLLNGSNSYEINIILPNEIKDYYNDTKLEIILKASNIELASTDAILNGTLVIKNINKFNRYNGVLASQLFSNAIFTVDGSLLSYDTVEYLYDYKTEGYFELKDGKNELNAKITSSDFEITTKISFIYNETRTSSNINIVASDLNATKISGDNYYYNTSNTALNADKYELSGTDLIDNFGLNDFDGYINYEGEIIDENSSNYLLNENNTYLFAKDEVSTIELIVFPNSDTLGAVKTINVYFSNTAPSDFPIYEIKPSLSYYPGTNFDFIISDDTVLYSLDGIDYKAELSINELGNYKVYYKIGDTITVKGSANVSITLGSIQSDNLDLISDNILILSNDNRSIKYYYDLGGEYVPYYREISSQDGTTISPITDIYKIYTDVLKNAIYYNSVTKETLDVDVLIKDGSSNPDFSYEIIKEGLVSLKGDVHFEFINVADGENADTLISDEGISINIILNVINPIDKTVSLSNLDTISASRTIYSIEDLTEDYEILFSIDEGKTWSDETPQFSEVGEYVVYSIYRFKCKISSDYDYIYEGTIVAIQNIIVTE